eukprot:CAMPEP_0170058510 /NCGR_PEP_ID=MMETSP0019_2-20121128/1112_1 /TAXON_ID=98059 /ORGANISM="Dinobryon sp., Strain UTEXLB2267" /LENGTH=407 /DNA_ID=CAMNT_0010263481 /DNA_START=203 /DNA_END=1426 /DNA_ORIENTATION=+
MTLLMCSEYKQGNIDQAMVYFDAGQQLYLYALGPHHPLLSMHLVSFADLYMETKLFAHAKVMLMLAQTASKKSLGTDHILNTLYDYKLAMIHMAEGFYNASSALLSSALLVLDAAKKSPSSGITDVDVIDCLYNLCLSYSQCGEVDAAIQSGFRCLELSTKLIMSQNAIPAAPTTTTAPTLHTHTSDGGTFFAKMQRPLTLVSTLLLLADLYMKKQEVDSAFDILQEAWSELKRRQCHSRAEYRRVARCMCGVAVRVLELILSSLPLQIRSLFDSVAGEVLSKSSHLREDNNNYYDSPPIKQQQREMARDKQLWMQAVSVAADAMWLMKPADYFSKVFQGIQSNETVERDNERSFAVSNRSNKKNKTNKKEVDINEEINHTSFEFQAAAISKLIVSTGHLSNSLLQN